jgi:hypothetical protein
LLDESELSHAMSVDLKEHSVALYISELQDMLEVPVHTLVVEYV